MLRFVGANFWGTITLGIAAMCAGAAIVSADDARPVTPQQRTPEQRLAKGKDLIDSVCFWCHEPELMKTKRLNQEEWAELIRPMVYEGAPLTKDEFQMIVEYLAKTFGPENESK